MDQVGNPFRTFEYEGWQRAARAYDDAFGNVTSQVVEPLLNAVHAAAGIRLLDVACGPGYVTSAAASRGIDCVGIDFSPEMILSARKRAPRLRFEQGDAEQLAFDNETFDAVVMNFGMLHLARPDSAIAEAFRVLRPRGRYAFSVWDIPENAVAFGIVLKAVQAHGDLSVPLPEGPSFFRFSDPQEAKRSLESAGFTEVNTWQAPQTWRLDSGESLYRIMTEASVRTSALLKAQAPDSVQRIKNQIAANAEKHRQGSHVELPMPAILSSGVKP